MEKPVTTEAERLAFLVSQLQAKVAVAKAGRSTGSIELTANVKDGVLNTACEVTFREFKRLES